MGQSVSFCLHARTTCDALSIGVVVFAIFFNGARAKKVCARDSRAKIFFRVGGRVGCRWIALDAPSSKRYKF